jgi:hypothetical protein
MRTKTALLLVLLFALPLCAQRRRHDPLSETEADQMREVAQDPDKRLKLIIKFANARMQSIHQLRSDPKAASGRSKQVHDLLDDFTTLVDELDDNINMYATRKQDLSRALGDVLVADSDWRAKLNAIKDDAKSAAEVRDYQFALDSALESVKANADNAQDLLDEIAKERAAAAAKKVNKDKDKDKAK